MIRPAERRDVPDIVQLHERVFGPPDTRMHGLPDLGYEEMLFEHPGREQEPAGLVYEREGRIVGSVAILPQPMRWGKQALRVLVPTKFIVEPGRVKGLVAAQLLRALTDVPHDLLIGDNATQAMLPFWSRVGGFVVPMHSVHWARSFQPSEHWRRRVAQAGGSVRGLAGLGRPLTRLLDSQLVRRGWNTFSGDSRIRVEEVGELDELLPLMRRAADGHEVGPTYDRDVLRWQLSVLRRMEGPDRELTGLVMRAADGSPAGWALYYAQAGGMSEVLQLHCLIPELSGGVVQALLEWGCRARAIAIGGRVDESVLPALASDRCTASIGNPWCIAATPHPELRALLKGGGVFYTRLEGEWW